VQTRPRSSSKTKRRESDANTFGLETGHRCTDSGALSGGRNFIPGRCPSVTFNIALDLAAQALTTLSPPKMLFCDGEIYLATNHDTVILGVM
jgi:hypothetical protein